jgi:TPR repeat protein
VSQSFDPVMRLVAHVPIKFMGVDWRFRDEAMRLYKLAADQGNAVAQSSLARMNGTSPAPK